MKLVCFSYQKRYGNYTWEEESGEVVFKNERGTQILNRVTDVELAKQIAFLHDLNYKN